MKQSKEMDQLKKVQLEHLEVLEKQNEQVSYFKGLKEKQASENSNQNQAEYNASTCKSLPAWENDLVRGHSPTWEVKMKK